MHVGLHGKFKRVEKQNKTKIFLRWISDYSKFAGYKASLKKAIDSSQIIIPYTLKSALCQSYHNKTGGKKKL